MYELRNVFTDPDLRDERIAEFDRRRVWGSRIGAVNEKVNEASDPLKAAADVRDALAPAIPGVIRLGIALAAGIAVYTVWSRYAS